MPEQLKLTVLEKNALDKGLATQRVRLKGGRIIWDDITKDLPPLTHNDCLDGERFLAFKEAFDKRPFYHQAALKEWLRTQIENGYTDLLGSDSEESLQIEIYKKHLKIISS